MIIIGAGGLSKEIISHLYWDNIVDNIILYDDININIDLEESFKIIKSKVDLLSYFNNISNKYIIGISNPYEKKRIIKDLNLNGGELSGFISSKSLIGNYKVNINDGVVILANSIISNNINIGTATLVNKAVIIGHDVDIGDYCSISPGVIISGKVKIGNETTIGSGAVINPGITIGSNAIIGSGSVIIEDVEENSTVVGVPGRIIKH